MPYEKHHDIHQPRRLNARIWRFLDLAEFLDLLFTGELYFHRADLFEDPYEGVLPAKARLKFPDDKDGTMATTITNAIENLRASYYINSWYLSEHEPAAMWKLYAGSDVGIAISSTYRSLREAFRETDRLVFMGLVQYDTKYLTSGPFNTLRFIMHKRPGFSHENEVRVFLWKTDVSAITAPAPDSLPRGVRLKVPVHEIVNEVILSPTAPAWVSAAIADMIKRYGYSFTVRKSDLYLRTL